MLNNFIYDDDEDASLLSPVRLMTVGHSSDIEI